MSAWLESMKRFGYIWINTGKSGDLTFSSSMPSELSAGKMDILWNNSLKSTPRGMFGMLWRKCEGNHFKRFPTGEVLKERNYELCDLRILFFKISRIEGDFSCPENSWASRRRCRLQFESCKLSSSTKAEKLHYIFRRIGLYAFYPLFISDTFTTDQLHMSWLDHPVEIDHRLNVKDYELHEINQYDCGQNFSMGLF